MKLNPAQKLALAISIAEELDDEEDEEEEEETIKDEDDSSTVYHYTITKTSYPNDDYEEVEEEEEPGIRKGRSYAEEREELWNDLGFSEKTKKRMNIADDVFGCVEALLNAFLK